MFFSVVLRVGFVDHVKVEDRPAESPPRLTKWLKVVVKGPEDALDWETGRVDVDKLDLSEWEGNHGCDVCNECFLSRKPGELPCPGQQFAEVVSARLSFDDEVTFPAARWGFAPSPKYLDDEPEETTFVTECLSEIKRLRALNEETESRAFESEKRVREAEKILKPLASSSYDIDCFVHGRGAVGPRCCWHDY